MAILCAARCYENGVMRRLRLHKNLGLAVNPVLVRRWRLLLRWRAYYRDASKLITIYVCAHRHPHVCNAGRRTATRCRGCDGLGSATDELSAIAGCPLG